MKLVLVLFTFWLFSSNIFLFGLLLVIEIKARNDNYFRLACYLIMHCLNKLATKVETLSRLHYQGPAWAPPAVLLGLVYYSSASIILNLCRKHITYSVTALLLAKVTSGGCWCWSVARRWADLLSRLRPVG